MLTMHGKVERKGNFSELDEWVRANAACFRAVPGSDLGP